MKNLIILIISALILATGCKKEKNLTDAQRSEQTLKTEISKHAIRRILPVIEGDFEPSVMDSEYGTNYSFENGVLNTTDIKIQKSYDLNKLKSYEIKTLTIKDFLSNTTKPGNVLVITFRK